METVSEAPGDSGPVFLENQKPGTADWRLSCPAINREIEGYASATSIAYDELLQLFISTSEIEYHLEIFRMGWYQGLGGRRVIGPIRLAGTKQSEPEPDPETGLVECCWTSGYELQIASSERANWVSGCFLAKLTALTSGKQAYILFVLRDDDRRAAILFQSSVTTFQAYNCWGSKCLYSYLSPTGKADKVSFNRPYALTRNSANLYGVGASDFLIGGEAGSPAGWEYCAVRFLEMHGCDVKYSTNVDTHRDGAQLGAVRYFLSVGHDEYWSKEMRKHVESARSSGTNLLFLGANCCYWQVRFEPSQITGQANRTLVCYKFHTIDFQGTVTRDPLSLSTMAHDHDRITIRWRDSLTSSKRAAMPEQDLIGIMYRFKGDDAKDDMKLLNTDHWVFAGTGVRRGDVLPLLIGYEFDRIHGVKANNLTILAESRCSGGRLLGILMRTRLGRRIGERRIRAVERLLVRGYIPQQSGDRQSSLSHMTITEPESGGYVFAAGTINWCWALDDWGTDQRESRLSRVAQRMILNLLENMPNRPSI